MSFSTDDDKKVRGVLARGHIETPKNQIFEIPKPPYFFPCPTKIVGPKNMTLSFGHGHKNLGLPRLSGETPAVTSVDDRSQAASRRRGKRPARSSAFRVFVWSIEVPPPVGDLSPDSKAAVTDSDDDDDGVHACEAEASLFFTDDVTVTERPWWRCGRFTSTALISASFLQFTVPHQAPIDC
jgi:hypothetical protein